MTISIVTTVLEQPDERNSQPLRFGSFGSRELPKRSLKYWWQFKTFFWILVLLLMYHQL